jgi:hypothetical protein
VDLRLFPGLSEGREILAGVAVERKFVLNHLEAPPPAEDNKRTRR